MDSAELEDMFFRHLPEQFVRRAVRMVFDARRRSFDETTAEYAHTEAENVRPWVTRGKIEGGLRDVADLHAEDGVTHRVIKASGTSWNHTEILAGPVLLTAGAVQTPCGPVNKADFRMGLAASNQDSFFETGEFASHLYVMLLHTGYRSIDPDLHKKYAHLAGSCYLAFPAADLDTYVHSINLYDRYPDVVQAQLPAEWDQDAIIRFMHNARKSSWLGAA